MKFCFLDQETTGLNRDLCDVWEIGVIVRGPDEPGGDAEYCWQIRPDLTHAEPKGLQIGGYYRRCQITTAEVGAAWTVVHPHRAADDSRRTTARAVAEQLAQLLDGAYLVAANASFDEAFVSKLLRANGQCATHHYHLIDVEALAAGAVAMPPKWDLNVLLARFGVPVDEADRHTALGDARLARDLFDTVMGLRPGAWRKRDGDV